MPTPWFRPAALSCVFAWLGALSSTAGAQLPPFGTPACPPNTSCIPSLPPVSPPGTCGPGNGGATCGGGGPAAMGSGTGVNVGAGNPINVINGNKYQREVDMAPLPGTLGLEIIRHYNSSHSKPGSSTNLVGRGWKLSYETDLYVSGRTVQIVQADGSRIIFNRDPRDPSLCASADPANGTVSIGKTGRGEEYTWRWADGRQLNFDSKGKLVQILAPNGQFVSLQHDRTGLLVKVTDPQGRSLSLGYLDKARARAKDAFRGVQSITSPVGRFTYHYGSPMPKGATAQPHSLLANLVKVGMPSGQRYYHYEDARFPTLLTGISEQVMQDGAKAGTAAEAKAPARLAWQRVATYGYDSNGKANLSVRGLPARLARGLDGKPLQPARLVEGTGIDQVTLDFGKGGQTVVTNERGQPTVFRHAIIGDTYRLLDVRGPGCANCGPSNVRYRYDDLGRLLETTTLAADGTPLAGMRTELDAQGRPLVTSKIAYRDGKPGAPQWQQRFEYTGAAAQPARIFRPSVVAGKEAVVTVAYAPSGAAAGQPVTVTEEGFVPSFDARVPAAVISRTIGYRYNGYGERSAVDGPLPNAGKDASPANSDLTITEFDPATKLPLRVRYPGNRVEEIVERDAALRPRVVRISDGALVRRITTVLNWRGQAERVEVAGTGSSATRYRYDVNGRLLATQDDSGEIRFAYDAGGRMIARILPDGRREPVRMADSEAAITTLAPAASPAPATGVDRDWLSRPVAWHGADGAAAVQTGWGAPGSAAEASMLSISAGDARAERLVDDFGRVSAIRNPGQGWQLARHDATGRIVESVDPRGARQQAEWDTAGRLLKLVRHAPGSTTVEQTLHYRYAGSLLREQEIVDADGARLTTNTYDAQGRILSQTLTITPARQLAAALPQAMTMRYDWHYDANGRLAGRSFTDAAGARFGLQEEQDAQGRTASIATDGALPAALGGRRMIASAIDWQTLAGVPFAQRIVHGDGSEDGFDVPSSPEPAMPDAPRLQQASLASSEAVAEAAPGTGLRRSPGRDTDAAGLPAAIATAAADQRLEWNAAGQLARSTRAGGSTRYLYDASRQRVARIVTDAQGRTTTTLFFHHEHHLIAETDAAGRAQYAYAYLGWRPLAQADLREQGWWGALKRWAFGAPLRHLHTDRAGRVLAMTQDGDTVWRDTDAAAPRVQRAALKRQAQAHQPLRYVSQYHDEDSGLSYHGLRWFDPGSGRFLSPDPAGIADAVQGLPAPLLLDLYAYAGGQPKEFFDPDGAARIRYFAITTGANGNAIGTTVGFVRARWAFIVDNVQAGTATSALGQKQNEYAADGTALLVDMNGNFLERGQSSVVWSGGGDSGIANLFTEHYGNNLISIPEFTIEMNDQDAAKLIASYINADRQALFGNSCPARNSLLPQIRFAPEEVPINVTSATMPAPGQAGQVLAQSQRIVECGAAAANDPVARRLEKYNYGAMLLESYPSAIGKDCSANGCPGMNLRNTVLPNYVASYGQTQFIGTTMVETLRRLRNNSLPIDAAGRTALRLDDAALWTEVEQAARRANYVVAEFNRRNAGTPDWNAASQAARNAFMTGTGLDAGAAATMWNDINRWKRSPTANFNGEARAAFATTVLMATPNVRNYLMGIFQDSARGGRFYQVSMALMRKSYNDVQGQVNQTNNVAPTLANGQPNPAWAVRQRQIEIELGMRTGRSHNGDYNRSAREGNFAAVIAADNANAGRKYGHRLMNAHEYPVIQPSNPNRRQPTADYFAMRCTADLPGSIPRGGIQVNPLNLP